MVIQSRVVAMKVVIFWIYFVREIEETVTTPWFLARVTGKTK